MAHLQIASRSIPAGTVAVLSLLAHPAPGQACDPLETFGIHDGFAFAGSTGVRNAEPLDFNGDGLTDLALADDRGVWVMLAGDGALEFGPPVLAVEAPPDGNFLVRLFVVDVDGDAIDDLVVAEELGTASVVFGSATGTVGPALVSPASGTLPGTSWRAVGDFDGDGLADLAGLSREGHTWLQVVRFGDALGTFGPMLTSPIEQRFLNAIAIDLDGDGLSELISTSQVHHPDAPDGLLRVQRIERDGSLTDLFEYRDDKAMRSVRSLDLNGDGRLDLLRNDSFAYFGDADAWLSPPVPTSEEAFGVGSVADLTGDGLLDVLSIIDGEIILYRNDGDATFSEISRQRGFDRFDLFGLAGFGEFTRDGNLDLVGVAPLTRPGQVRIIAGQGEQGLDVSRRVIEVGYVYDIRSPGDFNGDGLLDVLFDENAGLVAAISAGDGTFFLGPSTRISPLIPQEVVFGDIRGTGRSDAVVISSRGGPEPGLLDNRIYLLTNNGATWNESRRIDYGSQSLSPVRPFDMNNDGRDDLLLRTQPWFYGHDGDPVWEVYLGTENGFADEPLVVSLPDGFTATHDDIDGDGVHDVVLSTGGAITWSRGLGDGTFGPPLPVGDAGGLVLSTGDADGDGDADVLSAITDEPAIRIFLNDGAGAFAAMTIDAPAGANDPVVEDFNLDGLPDLAYIVRPAVAVAFGTAPLTWDEPRLYMSEEGFGRNHRSLRPIATDVDGDGDTDLLAGYLSVIENTCADSACAADVDRDGDLTPADLGAWLAAFDAGGPGCDQNADGACTPADFNAWVLNFNAGC